MDNKQRNKPYKTNLLSLKKNSQDNNNENNVASSCVSAKKSKLSESLKSTLNKVSRLDEDEITLSFDVNSYFQNDNLSQFQSQNETVSNTNTKHDYLNLTCSEFQLTNTEWGKANVQSSETVSSNSQNSELSQFYESSQVLKQIDSVMSSCEFKEPSPNIKVKQVLKSLKDNDEILNESLSNEISIIFKSSQYKREVSGLFDKLENTICQMNTGQDINLQTDTILSNSVINLDWDNDSMAQWNESNKVKISDKIKTTLLNNLQNPQKVTDTTVICNDFIEMGPFYGLPSKVQELIQQYKGIDKLYDWQDECLKLPAIKKRKNLIYALPTSGGKTLVSEILIFREILCRRKNALFVLPYVSIVQEKVWAISPFALALNFLVEEYAAGKGILPPRRRRTKRSIYIATIEKALALVNALIETSRISELGLVVVDELHLLGEPGRGATLEQLLSKIIQAKLKQDNINIHVVGMSATIGNLPELCTFLNAEVYTKNFRPVELKEYVKCGNQIAEINREAKTIDDSLVPVRTTKFDYSDEVAKIDPDRLAGLVMEVIPSGSCLVFCASKKNCENVSLLLCRVVPKQNLLQHKVTEKVALLEALKAEGDICKTLKRTVPFGVAYHHSGLTADERRLIEDAFRNGTLCVICCTSTLAAGVNLPAKRVILRSPYVGREFLTLARYKQMSGRAGRAGLGENIGESILLCESRDLSRVVSMLCSPMERVESRLMENDLRGLKNLILSCIALGTASTRTQLRQIAKCTLLSVQKNEAEVKQATDTVIVDLFKLAALQIENDKNTVPDTNISVLLQSSMVSSPKVESTNKKQIKINNDTRLIISKLGLAAIKGGLDLDTAHILYDDLVQAQNSLVLLNCLHLLYLITPYDLAKQMQPSMQTYSTIYMDLGQQEAQTARIIGLDEACCSAMMTGRKIKVKERILNRFYLTLILHDLWEGKGVFEVADKFQVSRGLVQQLMVAAATFAANVVRFCEQLDELWAFAELLKGLGLRLQHCAARDLEPLMELPAVKQARARQLLQAGYRTLQDVARADPREMMDRVEHISQRVANQLIASAKLLLLEKVENLREEAQDVLDGIGSSQ